jgi:SET and MYND domain-containing protein
MVNHSCIPNAVVVFWKRKAFLRAETPVKADEHITISYIGKHATLAPTEVHGD